MKKILCALVLGGSILHSGFGWGTSGMPNCFRQCESMCMQTATGAAYGQCLAGCMPTCTRTCRFCHANMAANSFSLERPIVDTRLFERKVPRIFLEHFQHFSDDDT